MYRLWHVSLGKFNLTEHKSFNAALAAARDNQFNVRIYRDCESVATYNTDGLTFHDNNENRAYVAHLTSELMKHDAICLRK